MQRSVSVHALLAVLLLFVTTSFTRAVDLTGESDPRLAFHQTVDVKTGETHVYSPGDLPGRVVAAYIYDNITAPSAPNFGYSEPVTNNPIYGDTLNMTGTGVLDELTLTIFNATTGGNTGTVTGGVMTVNFFRQSDNSLIGGFAGNYTFNPVLQPGFFATITFNNLATLATPVNIDTANVIVTQSNAQAGTSTRNGVVSLNPINIGTSPSTVFISSTATPAGFYNFNPAGTQSNFGYKIGVTPEPGTMLLAGLGLGGLALRRRKA
jgi:hypothetical protein